MTCSHCCLLHFLNNRYYEITICRYIMNAAG